MRRAAIVSPLRTGTGAFGGSLKQVTVECLGATVAKEIVRRTGVDPALIEDVVFAQSYTNGETPCTGRWIALEAGFPVEVTGMQLDRRCGGGLQAVATAAMMIQSGVADIVMAGGVESMSNVEYYTTSMRWGARFGSMQMYDRLDRGRERSQPVERFGRISGMIETAENLARDHKISRDESDAYAVMSHKRAQAALSEGKFDKEIVPLVIPQRKGEPVIFAQDEGIRADINIDKLAKLNPVIKGGVVTPGNSCPQNDAAAACLVVAEDKLKEFGLEPVAYLKGWAVAGCEPSHMGLGPVPAVEKLFRKTGLSFKDMDLVELNEAFACQVLAVLKGWNWDDLDKLNVNGSGISLGHPVGATGARIMTTLLYELERRNARYGLESLCIGGGQGLAAIFERP